MEAERSASQKDMAAAFPKYRAASLGLREYWYPVAFLSALGDKPHRVVLAGEEIALVRESGEVYALRDRCPHRGIPLSQGRKEYPGTVTCAYHGFTYELQSGELTAVLTDSPDSPICGKANVSVRTYPAAVRAGIVWVFVGDGPPPPVEEDIPKDLLAEDAVVVRAWCKVKPGNWRLGAEAGIDEGHARYLHRRSLWALFREFPTWTRFSTSIDEDGWLGRDVEEVHYRDTHPRVGQWPRKPAPFYKARGKGARRVAIRLPCVLRVEWRGWTTFEFFVPVDEDHRLEILLPVVRTRKRWKAALFHARYWAYIRWVYFSRFHGQDNWMIDHIRIPPEYLYGPDKSITAWRRLVEHEPRQGRAGTPEGAPAPVDADA